jgi:hypothetical protein
MSTKNASKYYQHLLFQSLDLEKLKTAIKRHYGMVDGETLVLVPHASLYRAWHVLRVKGGVETLIENVTVQKNTANKYQFRQKAMTI